MYATTSGVSIPQFILGIERAKQHPDSVFTRSIKCWWPRTGREIIEEYRQIIDQNINRRGRLRIRWCRDETTLRTLQAALRARCVIHKNMIPERYRARLSHRISL